MRKGYVPSTMTIKDFCKKYGFQEITTKRMEGPRWTNGKIDIGWTYGWFIYRYRTTTCGIFDTGALNSFYHNNKEQYPEAYDYFNNWNKAEIFPYILGYLDQFPRKGMTVNFIKGNKDE